MTLLDLLLGRCFANLEQDASRIGLFDAVSGTPHLALVAALALVSAGCDAAPGRSIPLPLKIVADVPIEHPSSRFDYESIDPTTGMLFIADLAGSRVLVFDTRANRFLKAIDGTTSWRQN